MLAAGSAVAARAGSAARGRRVVAASSSAKSSPSPPGLLRAPARPPRHEMTRLPKLIAFDLDGTLWWPEMYMLDGGAPFRRDKSGAVFDKRNERIELMGASEAVLRELATDPKWRDTEIAYVSRTEYPEWAIPCLKTFLVNNGGGAEGGDSNGSGSGNGSKDGRNLLDISSYQEIYPGSKITHFKKIHKDSGVAYEDMLFFDNEKWNCTECSRLGIVCVYTPRGLTKEAWERGLADFATAQASRQ